MTELFVPEVKFIAAFGAGILSFVSPCVLPIIPGYLSFISGMSLADMNAGNRKEVIKRVTFNTIFFVLGFSVVFVLLGATASSLGNVLKSNLGILNKIAGVIVVIFGLHIVGIFKIPFLNYEKRMHSRTKPLGFLGAFAVGLAFAFGWSPCIGPILAGILLIAANQATVSKGMLLLGVYSLGLGLPFLITGVAFNYFIGISSWLKRHFRAIEIVSGTFLIIVGVLIFFGSFTFLGQLLAKYFPWLITG
ncbi:MAG: cytochrome c biogenesis protein CcdA [candidate division Zixibacteria bacterium]|nr:cytochrome c biogenesis protein CcdA [candidate division Zixibacteria bacterium]